MTIFYSAFARMLAVFVLLLCWSCSTQVSGFLGYRFFPNRPVETGSVQIPAAVQADAWVDANGIPHISAESETAAMYALGYLHGRDRRFQMDVLTHLAAGRIREIAGDRLPAATVARLELYARAFDLGRDADAILADASDFDREVYQAYADGVNSAFWREPQPPEFTMVGYRPSPWTPRDSALILAFVAMGLGKNWEMELSRLEMIVSQKAYTAETMERVLAIWPPGRDWGGHLTGNVQPHPFPKALSAFGGERLDPALLEYLSVQSRAANPDAVRGQYMRETGALTGPGLSGGASNSWAVMGRLNGGGGALLASDPHLSHMMPGIGYLAHIQVNDSDQGWDIAGAGFAGVPAIVFGGSRTCAWGVTANWADTSDLYIEKDLGNGHYQTLQGSEPYRVREEHFLVRTANGFRTENIQLRETLHGTVLNDVLPRLVPGFPVVALARVRAGGPTLSAFRNLYRATTVREGLQALGNLHAFTGHWSLADAQGSIAYTGTGKVPVRRHHTGTLPVPGWIEHYTWKEFRLGGELPVVVNPDAGFLVTANQQVLDPAGLDMPVNLEGETPFRYLRIVQLLGEAAEKRLPMVETSLSIQQDRFYSEWPAVRTAWREVLESAPQGPASAIATLLLTWNGEETQGPQPVVWYGTAALVLREVIGDETASAALEYLLGYFNGWPLFAGILVDFDNPAWDNRRTPARESAGEVIHKALASLHAQLLAQKGSDPSKWGFEKSARLVYSHPLASAAGGWGNRSARASGGIHSPAKQQFSLQNSTDFTITDGPVLRVVVDLGNPERSRYCLPGGQSGWVDSRHYDDLLPLWERGQGVPISRDWTPIRNEAALHLSFAPAASKVPQGSIGATWLGNACWLFETSQLRILTDPGELLSGRLNKERIKALGKIDMVIITHTDPDHCNLLSGIENYPDLMVAGPAELRRDHPEIRLMTPADLEKDGWLLHLPGSLEAVKLRFAPAPHGLRHDKEHYAFELFLQGRSIQHLGDAFRPPAEFGPGADLMLVTIGGMETNAEAALASARILRPKTLAPMHWEFLGQDYNPGRSFVQSAVVELPDSSIWLPSAQERRLLSP